MDLPWVNYANQTTDELLALEGKVRSDGIVSALDCGIRGGWGGAIDANHSEAERLVVGVEELEREVNNGGYSQFFTNSSYKVVPFIVGYLWQIGADVAATITQQAIDALGLPPPLDPAAVRQFVEEQFEEDDSAVLSTLDALDRRYYEEVDDISGLLLSFIKANRASIRTRPLSPESSH
jgi:hypothetical protein